MYINETKPARCHFSDPYPNIDKARMVRIRIHPVSLGCIAHYGWILILPLENAHRRGARNSQTGLEATSPQEK